MESGASPLEVWKVSNNFIPSAIEMIRHYLNVDQEKQAFTILLKTWHKFQYLELIEVFMNEKNLNEKTSLRRYKMVLKALKSSIDQNETKFALAKASFKAFFSVHI